MTTRGIFGSRPVLDRLLTRSALVTTTTVTVTPGVAGDTHRWVVGDATQAGFWDNYRDGGGPAGGFDVNFEDYDGGVVSLAAFPPTPFELTITRTNRDTITYNVTDNFVLRQGNPVTAYGLRFIVVEGDLGTQGGEAFISFAVGATLDTSETTSTTEEIVTTDWCQVRDFTGKNELTTLQVGGVVELSDRLFVVRNRADAPWKVTDDDGITQRFTFEDVSYTIRGVSEMLGRKQYLVIVGRSAT